MVFHKWYILNGVVVLLMARRMRFDKKNDVILIVDRECSMASSGRRTARHRPLRWSCRAVDGEDGLGSTRREQWAENWVIGVSLDLYYVGSCGAFNGRGLPGDTNKYL